MDEQSLVLILFLPGKRNLVEGLIYNTFLHLALLILVFFVPPRTVLKAIILIYFLIQVVYKVFQLN